MYAAGPASLVFGSLAGRLMRGPLGNYEITQNAQNHEEIVARLLRIKLAHDKGETLAFN